MGAGTSTKGLWASCCLLLSAEEAGGRCSGVGAPARLCLVCGSPICTLGKGQCFWGHVGLGRAFMDGPASSVCLLVCPWTARSSNQSILKEISPECSLEGLMLKLKLQYFGHMMRRIDSLEKTLMMGKTEGKRRRGQQTLGKLRAYWSPHHPHASLVGMVLP